jgi:hypothetical protein
MLAILLIQQICPTAGAAKIALYQMDTKVRELCLSGTAKGCQTSSLRSAVGFLPKTLVSSGLLS